MNDNDTITDESSTPFISVARVTIFDTRISKTAYRLHHVLIARCAINESHSWDISYKELCKDLDASRQTISDAIKNLIELGLVRKDATKYKNRYFLCDLREVYGDQIFLKLNDMGVLKLDQPSLKIRLKNGLKNRQSKNQTTHGVQNLDCSESKNQTTPVQKLDSEQSKNQTTISNKNEYEDLNKRTTTTPSRSSLLLSENSQSNLSTKQENFGDDDYGDFGAENEAQYNSPSAQKSGSLKIEQPTAPQAALGSVFGSAKKPPADQRTRTGFKRTAPGRQNTPSSPRKPPVRTFDPRAAFADAQRVFPALTEKEWKKANTAYLLHDHFNSALKSVYKTTLNPEPTEWEVGAWWEAFLKFGGDREAIETFITWTVQSWENLRARFEGRLKGSPGPSFFKSGWAVNLKLEALGRAVVEHQDENEELDPEKVRKYVNRYNWGDRWHGKEMELAKSLGLPRPPTKEEMEDVRRCPESRK